MKQAGKTPPSTAGRPRKPRRRAGAAAAPRGTGSLLAIPLFLLVYVAVALAWEPPPWWFAAAYGGLGLVTFCVYAFDKSAARAGRWRTPESTLHLWALAGGWPGALLAQQLLRHKSSKAPFRAVFWLTVVLNVAGFIALWSPLGEGLRAAVRHGL